MKKATIMSQNAPISKKSECGNVNCTCVTCAGETCTCGTSKSGNCTCGDSCNCSGTCSC